MRKKLALLFIVVLMISFFLFSLLFPRHLEIKVQDEPIIVDQQEGVLLVDMIEEHFKLFFSDKEVEADTIELIDEVDLSKPGVQEVTLEFKYRKKSIQETVQLTVVDRQAPELIIKDDEFVFLKGSAVNLTADQLLINAYDGLNGLINERIEFLNKISTKKTGKSTVKVKVSDASGNVAEEELEVRVTDNIDEYAKSLYDKSIKYFHGDYFVFKDLDRSKEILNFEQGLSLLTQAQFSHFKWLSGLEGEYDNRLSGIKLTMDEKGKVYGDSSEHKHPNNYKETTLKLKYKTDDYREYEAISYYKDKKSKKDKVGYRRKFVIIKEDKQWKVNEFYLPY